MSEQNSNDTIAFDLPKNQSSVIKVIGVGGGGSNAVNHMYNQGIKGVDFVVCNTDSQALGNSPVPNKVQLGVTLTEGLGAGANPEVGQEAAIESIEELKNLLGTNTKMVFITAGMGGGTGTGAAPVIAKTAKEAGILTVGICTIPFQFEGSNRRAQAEKGVEALRNAVDSLIVINNNKLREVYGNLGYKTGFAKADEVLATAARGIAEVITHHYTTNIDLRDAKTVLSNSGTAIMGSASASGENRATESIRKALDSPLLNDNHIKGAKNVLLLIVSGKEEITIDEIGEINDHIQAEAGGDANIIMGIGEDDTLDEEIAVTIVATGFTTDQQVHVIGREPQKVIHTLEDDQPISAKVYSKPLKQDEETTDENLIDKEIAKFLEKPESNQPNLFEFENTEEENRVEAPIEEEETVHFSLEEEEDEMEDLMVAEDEVERSEPVTEPIFKKEEPSAIDEKQEEDNPIELSIEEEAPRVVFTLDDDDEDEMEENLSMKEVSTTEIPTSAQAEEPIKKEEKAEAKPEKEEIIRYTLEEYRNLESQLINAKAPKEEEPKAEKPTADEDLKFEVKKRETPVKRKVSSEGISPAELTIEESMKLKAERSRTQLKAFNYRFKNQPHTVDEVSNEPAYKRQGVKIENGNYSTEGSISRFTIDDNEDGADIKTNNSFLHDNVD